MGVIAAALLKHYTGWYQADPLISISIAIGLLIKEMSYNKVNHCA